MNTDKHRWNQARVVRNVFLLSVSICVHLWLSSSAHAETNPQFEKKWLSAQFFGEGADFGDFNKDGKPDVVSGPFIYDGPDFSKKHAFMPVEAVDPLGYSQNFFTFTHDFNGDGYDDIMIVGFPGQNADWYENPKGADSTTWTKHNVATVVDNESPSLLNVVGKDMPELVCCSGGTIGYFAADASDPTKPWTYHAISPKADYQRFTHGIGAGDVNGDGRIDILERGGWWEQPEKLDGDPQWTKHELSFSDQGCSQMFTYDVDNDGDNDVINSLNAHGYGLAWWENVKDDKGNITFKQHLILSSKQDEKMNDVQFSQLHAVALVDMDGDGVLDILTGKRYWAHGPHGDPDPNGTPYLYYFRLAREQDKEPKYEPVMIDDVSGVGTQIVGKDVNGDKKGDVVVGNKKGTMVFLSK